MSHCVPSWDIDDTTTPPASKRSLSSHSNSTAPAVPMLDYEVAELTWENGQVAMHGLGPPRLPPVKPFSTTSPPPSKYTATTTTWVDKQPPNIPRACGTLESIVNQAAATKAVDHHELVTWFDNHRATTAAVSPSPAPSTTVTMDALVPCRSQNDDPSSTQVIDSLSVPVSGVFSTQVKQTTGVGSCSGAADTGTGVTAAATQNEDILFPKKQTRMTRVPATPEWTSSRSPSVSGSGTFGMDSHHVTLDTKASDHDSVCHSTPQRNGSDEEDRKKRSTGKSSVSTKRSRAAAVHNQSERKRRDKINQRMKTLQKLVPNSSKTDKASMLDEVIEYLKQLQAQVQMMSRMNMPAMMLPMALQQQLQMSMMAPRSMGLGIGMGMGMDMNTIGRPNITGIPPILHPSAFMPMASWDGAGTGDKLQAPSAAAMPDPLSAFLACQSQPMTMDSYSMMTAMYQQFQQPPASIVPRAN